jgi:hypothetical protein
MMGPIPKLAWKYLHKWRGEEICKRNYPFQPKLSKKGAFSNPWPYSHPEIVPKPLMLNKFKVCRD